MGVCPQGIMCGRQDAKIQLLTTALVRDPPFRCCSIFLEKRRNSDGNFSARKITPYESSCEVQKDHVPSDHFQ